MSGGRSTPVWRRMGASPRPTRQQAVEILVIGAGPVGLAMALDLARRGREVLVVTKLDFIAAGSKAICFAKRSLDIFDRLGVGDRMMAKGVVWNVGKVFWGTGDKPIYEFDMLPVKDQKRPAFINLQQYYVEEYLVDALAEEQGVEIRWGHEVVSIAQERDGVTVGLRTAEGDYAVSAQWAIACDGSRSSVRSLLGLDFDGRVFEDNFLIADIKTPLDLPPERWFWFDPPFNPGQSALLHKQPDNVWRLDFQLGWNIDRKACVQPENVAPLVRGMLGEDAVFTPEWYSVYSFQCRRMSRFVHGRIIFAGDSAHLVSPFGARGCNGGIADTDNLGWKLDLILRGEAPPSLLDSYDAEAIAAADVNILNSTRSTDFLTPKSAISRIFRDAVLELAASHSFARRLVNSGRLSTAIAYPDSPLNTRDEADWTGGISPGSPAVDAPLSKGWLLERLGGRFAILSDGGRFDACDVIDIRKFGPAADGLRNRYALAPGAAYLIRPDHYVAARWHSPSTEKIAAALTRAKGG